jgi:hypothetical protein
VYGGTAAGVIAAVQLKRLGHNVALVTNGSHLGGMTTGGLSFTDFGNKAAIGGMSRELYRRIGALYGVDEEWCFEPHVAEAALDGMVAQSGLNVYTRQYVKSARKEEGRLVSLTTESGLTVKAQAFIDASYEGDLMALAGVSYAVGREGNETYGETLNGVQLRQTHQFNSPVDPYLAEGHPASGVLPGIDPKEPGPQGSGDKRVQAYNFRLCLTKDPTNRIPFPKPEGYDPARYTLLARYLATGWNEVTRKFDGIRGSKVDMNNHGGFSTDFIGGNYAYPEADHATRERIFQDHVSYQQGLMYFLANDPSVPEAIRAEVGPWGLCRDEFTDTGGWPRQLYIREARRMVSDTVMTEHNCKGEKVSEDPVGLGAYNMDSHNCSRFAKGGRVWNEGDVQVGGYPPYPISYRSIVPRKAECQNLLVPVCMSASHIAYGSIRMEPVFMILAQSAALAADLALRGGVAVQDVPYTELRPALERAGQVLGWPVKGGS